MAMTGPAPIPVVAVFQHGARRVTRRGYLDPTPRTEQELNGGWRRSGASPRPLAWLYTATGRFPVNGHLVSITAVTDPSTLDLRRSTL